MPRRQRDPRRRQSLERAAFPGFRHHHTTTTTHDLALDVDNTRNSVLLDSSSLPDCAQPPCLGCCPFAAIAPTSLPLDLVLAL